MSDAYISIVTDGHFLRDIYMPKKKAFFVSKKRAEIE